VIGINPTTGTQAFSSPSMQQSSVSYNSTYNCTGPPSGPGSCSTPGTSTNNVTYYSQPTVLGTPIVAGDGYAYVAYEYQTENYVDQATVVSTICSETYSESDTTDTVMHLMLMRTGTDGTSSKIDVQDWESKSMGQEQDWENVCTLPATGNSQNSGSQTGAVPSSLSNVQLITNADQGVAISWIANMPTGTAPTPGFATTSGTSVSSFSVNSPVAPVLQAQDGTFYGTDNNGNMIRITQSGQTSWSVPNDYPQIATADGGVIGASGITYDSNGNATGQIPTPIQSWTGSETGSGYEYGSVDQVAFTPPIIYAVPPFSSFAGTNQSANGTSAVCNDDRDKLITEYPKYNAGYLPVCFASEFVPTSNVQPSYHFTFAELNTSDINYSPPDFPDWAVLRSVLLSGLENTRANYGNAITINSAYRSPLVQHAVSPQYPHDRHIHGDAADMATGSAQTVWNALHSSAIAAGACVEPETQSTVNHVHADWRGACPAGWRN
jgi:hypothetical protein